jgi:hypothetical protein
MTKYSHKNKEHNSRKHQPRRTIKKDKSKIKNKTHKNKLKKITKSKLNNTPYGGGLFTKNKKPKLKTLKRLNNRSFLKPRIQWSNNIPSNFKSGNVITNPLFKEEEKGLSIQMEKYLASRFPAETKKVNVTNSTGNVHVLNQTTFGASPV